MRETPKGAGGPTSKLTGRAKFDGWVADREGVPIHLVSPLARKATLAELTPELAEKIQAALAENAEEAAGAIGRAFEGEYVLKAGESAPLGDSGPTGAGMVFAFKFGEESMLALLPAEGGLVPDWAKAPDPTGESKLNTLGQELSMLLVPDTLMADGFEGVWVEDLAAARQRAEPAADATTQSIEVARGEALGSLVLAWPVAAPDAALQEAGAPDAEANPAEDAAPGGEPQPAAEPPSGPRSKVIHWNAVQLKDFRDLPPNALSALQVSVVLSVSLAEKKMPLNDVIELGPGAIITFDKSCDDELEIKVGERSVAVGEAVKVGERFGVRVQQMILPEEHFRPMLPSQPLAS